MGIQDLRPQLVYDLVREGFGQSALRRAREERKVNWKNYRAQREMDNFDPRTKLPGREWSPLNLHAQQVRTIVTALAGAPGIPVVTAKFSQLAPVGKLTEAVLRQQDDRLDVAEIYQELVMDAVLSPMTFTKCGWTTGQLAYVSGNTETLQGEAFEEIITLDDYVCDPRARRRRERRFEGFRFRISREQMIAEQMYGSDRPGAEQINPYVGTMEECANILKQLTHLSARSMQDRVAGDGMGGYAGEAPDDTDIVELWELEWRDGGETFTIVLPAEPNNPTDPTYKWDKFLAVQKSAAPSEGTLDMLTFLPDAEHVVPLGLSKLQRDLAIVADLLMMKIVRRALRHKNVNMYKKGKENEALTIRKSEDGEMVGVAEPGDYNTAEFGGEVTSAVESLKEVLSQRNNTNGNLDLVSGEGDVGGTATEFQGLSGRVDSWMGYLEKRVVRVRTANLKRRALYIREDKTFQTVIPRQVLPNLIVPESVSSYDLCGAYTDYQYGIKTGSMRMQDAAVQANQKLMLISQAFPALQALVMSGLFKPTCFEPLGREFGWEDIDQFLADPSLMMAQQGALAALNTPPGLPPGSGMPGTPAEAPPPPPPPQGAPPGPGRPPQGAPGTSPRAMKPNPGRTKRGQAPQPAQLSPRM